MTDIKAYTFTQDCGDGSVYVIYFSSEEAAEKYAEQQDQRYCDDVRSETFEVVDGVLKPMFGWGDE